VALAHPQRAKFLNYWIFEFTYASFRNLRRESYVVAYNFDTKGGLKMKKLVLLLAFLAFAPTAVMAHSGGTDRQGCHVDHKTGIRHCH